MHSTFRLSKAHPNGSSGKLKNILNCVGNIVLHSISRNSWLQQIARDETCIATPVEQENDLLFNDNVTPWGYKDPTLRLCDSVITG